jgi:hypothetical protein
MECRSTEDCSLLIEDDFDFSSTACTDFFDPGFAGEQAATADATDDLPDYDGPHFSMEDLLDESMY